MGLCDLPLPRLSTSAVLLVWCVLGTYLPRTTCPRRGRCPRCWRGSTPPVGSGLPHTPTLSCKSGTPLDRPRQASLRDSASALACARPHLEVVVLQRQEPARPPGVGIFGRGHPLQGGVVCDQGEGASEEVVAELLQGPLYRQRLLLYGRVGFLAGQEFPADIRRSPGAPRRTGPVTRPLPAPPRMRRCGRRRAG